MACVNSSNGSRDQGRWLGTFVTTGNKVQDGSAILAKIADALGLSDDVVLLPHLKSLASAENVVAINPRR